MSKSGSELDQVILLEVMEEGLEQFAAATDDDLRSWVNELHIENVMLLPGDDGKIDYVGDDGKIEWVSMEKATEEQRYRHLHLLRERARADRRRILEDKKRCEGTGLIGCRRPRSWC